MPANDTDWVHRKYVYLLVKEVDWVVSLHIIFCRFFTRGQFWPSRIVVACVCVCVCLSVCPYVCQSLACPRDNSGPVQARIAKFGPKMQKTLVKVPIVLGDNWPWPSRSNLTSNSKLTPFWACPNHYSPLWFPNLDNKCILALLRSLLIQGLIDLELHPHF